VPENIIEPYLVPTRQEIRQNIRSKIVEAIQVVLEEELTAVLGSQRYERSEHRRGFRHGKEVRPVTTEHGLLEIPVPRGRVLAADGSTTEFQSAVLPRYGRRTREVDEAILGSYLAGANTRRIRKALQPLLGEANLSKSAVSRVVARLKEVFSRWSTRDLGDERHPIIFFDAIHIKVRLARRVVSAPVLIALGIDRDGTKKLIAMQLATSECGASWGALVTDLGQRGLAPPKLVVSDGHPGLKKAIQLWPSADVQRCTHHKYENLVSHCPVHARAELKRDYDRITHAPGGLEARKRYDEFHRKWSKLCPPVVRSLEEGGEQLLTFYSYPRGLWRAIRTTNTIENLNREFRRRTKTQASFSTETGAVTLLFGLTASGQIQMRRIDGYRHLAKLEVAMEAQAA
jgi:putative transposase